MIPSGISEDRARQCCPGSGDPGPATGLSLPVGLVVDNVHDEIIVPNADISSVTVYDRTASGNVTPLRTLQGGSTGLAFPNGIALDRTRDEIIVANRTTSHITVHARAADGDVAPLRTIGGASTGVSQPVGVIVDLVNDQLVVANLANGVVTFPRTADGNVSPVRLLTGPSTGLNGPTGIATLRPVTLAVVKDGSGDGTVTSLAGRDRLRDGLCGGLRRWCGRDPDADAGAR